MKWKLGLALIVAAATLQLSSSQSQAQFPLAGNSISRLVNSARLNGQTALKLAAPMTLPPMVPTLADAFQEYTVVRALVSASMPGVVGDHHIFTFYKLYALEVLSRQTKIEEEPLHLDIPPALLPLVHSEILLRVSGGSLTINGVQAFQACWDDKYTLEVGKEYLMALYLQRGGDLALSAAGSSTILRIEGQKLIPLRTEDNPFWQDIETLHNGDLNSLLVQARARLK